tara:strand:- start:61398 stop:61808 length:411 start_codon:yes stop_codon:yes gene_type:complete
MEASSVLGWFVYILFAHFIADFCFQSHRVASNKSKSWLVLCEHIVIYSFVLGLFGSAFIIGTHGRGHPELLYALWTFVWVNGVAHFFTDAITSRITSYLWKKEKVHLFFVVIGADQFLHVFALACTFNFYLLKGTN